MAKTTEQQKNNAFGEGSFQIITCIRQNNLLKSVQHLNKLVPQNKVRLSALCIA